MICRRRDKDLNELLGRFKSYTSKKFLFVIEGNLKESRKEWLLYLFSFFAKKNKQNSNYHLWNYTNYPTILFNNAAINEKRNYIHQNPVRAGLTINEYSYLYSSACLESPLKVLELINFDKKRQRRMKLTLA